MSEGRPAFEGIKTQVLPDFVRMVSPKADPLSRGLRRMGNGQWSRQAMSEGRPAFEGIKTSCLFLLRWFWWSEGRPAFEGIKTSSRSCLFLLRWVRRQTRFRGD